MHTRQYKIHVRLFQLLRLHVIPNKTFFDRSECDPENSMRQLKIRHEAKVSISASNPHKPAGPGRGNQASQREEQRPSGRGFKRKSHQLNFKTTERKSEHILEVQVTRLFLRPAGSVSLDGQNCNRTRDIGHRTTGPGHMTLTSRKFHSLITCLGTHAHH